MIKTGKLAAIVGLTFGLVFPSATFAQSTAEPTARQLVVSFVTGVPVEDLRFATESDVLEEPAPVEVIPQSFKNILPPLPPETVGETSVSAEISSPAERVTFIPENLAETGRLPETPITQTSEPTPVVTKGKENIWIQPFYVHADQYLKARGTSNVDQVVLDYEVTPINPVLGLSANPKSVRLVIGPDFAAVTREGKTRIFDFKMRRLLTERSNEKGSEKGLVFDNVSLFPIALKNIETVKSATNNGTRDQIPVGAEKTLDAFWMEASLGWSARENVNGLSFSGSGTVFKALYNDKLATEVKLEGPVLLSEDFRSSLFAFLHHDVAIHPIVLKELGLPVSAPSFMTVTSFSPNYPDGLKTVWELKRSETVSRSFPLSMKAKAAISTASGSPIEFVIYNDRQSKTHSKLETHDLLRQKVHEARSSGDIVSAWLAAKDLESRLGGCEADLALLCQDIDDIESSASAQSDLGRLLWAMKPQKSAALRMTALEVLAKYTAEKKAPAFLLKAAGMTRARVKAQDITNPVLKSLRADRLLEEALAKNPADPEIYRSLSQVYAAQRRYVESWNLQDALRRMSNTPESLIAPINRVENALEKQAPAFFIPQFQ